MDTARQIIRWALPGWVGYFFFTGFIIVHAIPEIILDEILYGQGQSVYLDVIHKMSMLVIPLGVAAIPLGFIIYQIYYWNYWYVPNPSIFNKFVHDPEDRGRQILANVEGKVNFKHIFKKTIQPTPQDPFVIKLGNFHFKSIKIMRLYRDNWHLSDSAWYLALADDRYKNTSEFLEKRNQLLADIYHSMAACYHALVIAFIAYGITFLYVSIIQFRAFIFFAINPGSHHTIISLIFLAILQVLPRLFSLVVNVIAAPIAFLVFKGGREASFEALSALKHDVITNVMLNKPRRKRAS